MTTSPEMTSSEHLSMRVAPPSAPPTLPKIPVRLFRRDLILVRPILSIMFNAIRPIRSDFPWLAERLTDFMDEIGARIPNEVWEVRIEQLWKYLFSSTDAGRPRLRMDFLDLSLCQLAVRSLLLQVKHRRLAAPRPDYVPARKRFLRILEKLRRRARTAAIRSIGKPKYVWISGQWRQYERLLRQYAIQYDDRVRIFGMTTVGRTRRSGGYDSNRYFIARVMKIAEQELTAENLPIPNKRVLRNWARLLIRSVRRHREGTLNVSRLVESPAGHSCIRFFMRRKVQE